MYPAMGVDRFFFGLSNCGMEMLGKGSIPITKGGTYSKVYVSRALAFRGFLGAKVLVCGWSESRYERQLELGPLPNRTLSFELWL